MYLCTIQWYFWHVQLMSDARRVRWHSADVNPEVVVTLLRGEVTTSARHEVLYKQRYRRRNQCNDIRSYGWELKIFPIHRQSCTKNLVHDMASFLHWTCTNARGTLGCMGSCRNLRGTHAPCSQTKDHFHIES